MVFTSIRTRVEASEVCERRSARLASVLSALLPLSIDTVAVLCCDEHEVDAHVAVPASHLVGAEPVCIPIHVPVDELRGLLAEAGATVLLACSEGTELWRACGYPLVVFGDGPGVRWWRAAELRAEPLRVEVRPREARS